MSTKVKSQRLLKLDSLLTEAPKGWENWSKTRQKAYLDKHPHATHTLSGTGKSSQPTAQAKITVPKPKPSTAKKPSEPKVHVAPATNKKPEPTQHKEPEKTEPKAPAKKTEPSKGQTDPESFRKHIEGQKIKHGKFIGGGVNPTFVIHTETGRKAIYKPFAGNKAMERDSKNAHAVAKLMEDMGMSHLTPNFHIGTANGDIEGLPSGSHHGSYMEFVGGKPIGEKAVVGSDMQDVIKNVKGSDIVNAAIVDVLINNRDRNYANLLVEENGALHLIDHDLTMGHSEGSLRSPFLPQSNYGDILKNTAYEHLHYTKHVDGGKIGKNYPEAVKKVLDEIQKSDTNAVATKYGLDKERAKSLKKRVDVMVNEGFEAAAEKYSKKEPSKHPGVSPNVKPVGGKINQPRISPVGKGEADKAKKIARAQQRYGKSKQPVSYEPDSDEQPSKSEPKAKEPEKAPAPRKASQGKVSLFKRPDAPRETDSEWNAELERQIDDLLNVEKSKDHVGKIRTRDLRQMRDDLEKGRWSPLKHAVSQLLKKLKDLIDINKQYREKE